MLVQIKRSRLFAGFFFRSCCQVKNQCLSISSGQDSLLVCFQKKLLSQEPMLVQIKRARLFAGLFSEVVARSRTNVCPDQAGKTLCWFVFRSCC